MKMILKGAEILKRSGQPNAHQLALRSMVSYPSVDKYINRPEQMHQIDPDVLIAILTNGLGLTPEQILDLRLGDIFNLVNDS